MQARTLAKEMNISLYEVSISNNKLVDDAFMHLISQVFNRLTHRDPLPLVYIQCGIINRIYAIWMCVCSDRVGANILSELPVDIAHHVVMYI